VPGVEVPEGFERFDTASPFTEAAGPVYLRRGERGFVLGTRVTKLHLNRGGRLHGGVAAMLADVVLSRNVIESSGGVRHVTASLTVDFLASADLGDCWSVPRPSPGAARRASFGTAEVHSRRRLIAQASGVFLAAPSDGD
jgi:acyl-coenzyme A thioesterase PaaI-like protein